MSSPARRITSNWWSNRYDGEHRDVGLGGRDPGHPLLFPGRAVLGPAAGQNDGLRRHSVGVDTAFHGDVRGDAARHDGGQPLRQHRGQGGDVPARALQVVDARTSWDQRPVHWPQALPSRQNYDTVGSVMKADLSSVDKGPGAGRPRDPRIDAAILAATADLLVEIGYAEPDDGRHRRSGGHHEDGAVSAVVQQDRPGPRGGVPRRADRAAPCRRAISPPMCTP